MIDKYYKKLPIGGQNLAISLKGYQFEWFRINKKLSLSYLEFLKESEKWSLDQIKDYQLVSLNKVLQDAFKYVPYYRRLKENGIYIERLMNLDEISKLPILEKSLVKAAPFDFLDERFKNKVRSSTTSGSTGSPMKYFITTDIFSKRWAFELRLRYWAGLKNVYLPKRAHFTGKNIFDKYNISRYNTAQNTLHFSSDFITKESAVNYAEKLCEFDPEFIDGYPSCIQVLASICLENHINLPSPRAIRVSGENLDDDKKIIIESAFNTKVFNQYGSRETTAFFSTDPFGEFVVHPEFSFVELINSSNQNDLEKEIITSPLFENNCMPLIRYKTGDFCIEHKYKKETFVDYNNFKKIFNLSGRIEDTIYVEGMGYVQRLSTCFYGIDSIIEGQLVFQNKKEIKANVVVNDDISQKDLYQLKLNLEKKLSNLINVEVVIVDSIPRGPNGKFKFLVNKI